MFVVSVPLKDFTLNTAIDMQAYARRTEIVTYPRSKPSRRIIIRGPTKPAIVAPQRRALAFSPRKTAAATVAKRRL